MLDEITTLSRKFIDLRYRDYRRYFIKSEPLDHKFSIILGDRGIGKTTTLTQYLMDYANNDINSSKILYVQSDHIMLGSTTLYDIAQTFQNLGTELIAFDEIHKYQNWSIELKSITDSFPQLKIIASGSSALEIHKGSHDLSRRAIVYQMHGMSLREYIELTLDINLPTLSLDEILNNHVTHAQDIVKTLGDYNVKVLSVLQNYLKLGYYPYFLEYPNYDNFTTTLEQNIHTTIEADLVAIHPELTGNSIKKIKHLMSFIAQAVPFTPSWSKMKSIIDVSDNRTVKTYFKYLEDAKLIRNLIQKSGKLSELEHIEKIFLNNTNQLHALSFDGPDKGTVRELYFLSMLQVNHKVIAPQNGDFIVDRKYTFEIGGRKKSFEQIKNAANPYLAIDNVEVGVNNKIPLWMFGFLY